MNVLSDTVTRFFVFTLRSITKGHSQIRLTIMSNVNNNNNNVPMRSITYETIEQYTLCVFLFVCLILNVLLNAVLRLIDALQLILLLLFFNK